MIGTALRMAGQRLPSIVAPLGKKALAREAITTGAINAALEQGLSLALTGAPAPLGESLARSAGVGLLSGPVERGVLAGVKYLYPGVSGMQGRVASQLGSMGLKEGAANRLAGLAAGTGKLGLGVVGAATVVDPLAQAVTHSIIPENTPQGVVGDMPMGMMQPVPPMINPNQQGMDPEALEHQRKLELIYARNYKFPSYIHHSSSSTAPKISPFTGAMEMTTPPSVNYF